MSVTTNYIPRISVPGFFKTLLTCVILCFAGGVSFATAWTTSAAGPVNTLSNWTDGSGSPSTFATPGDTWTIAHSMTISSSGTWTVGTASAAPVTVTFATGGTLSMGGAGGTTTVIIHGSVTLSGGTLSVGGAGTTQNVTVNGNLTVGSGTISTTGSSSHLNVTSAGVLAVSGGAISPGGAAGVIAMTNTGDFNMTGGTIGASSDITIINNGNFTMSAGSFSTGGDLTLTINGNSVVTGGTFATTGASSALTVNTHGSFGMSAGTFTAGGAGADVLLNAYGNCSFSGPCAMTSTGAGTTSTVHFMLPSASGTMLINNTSTGTWSGTNVYIDAGCTAQLAGNFSTNTGGAAFGVTLNGTLICPAAYVVDGIRRFTISSMATLVVAHAAGINGAITTTGSLAFSPDANYTYNGSVPQVTGTYLPASLGPLTVLTISNSAGVTLTQLEATSGTLAFTAGILNTSVVTMTTPGAASAVTGAGATSYVNGTLIKTIAGLTSVNYEVGNVNYAPMQLTFSTAGTGGSLGVRVTNGLHPSVVTSGLSSANMANHYWRVTNYSASGPATITPKATYNAGDILGGSNASFLTQKYTSSAWLSAGLASTNTSSPYTSVPTTGIALASVAGDYIFGNVFCGTAPITGTASLCVGGTTTLADATPAGTWNSASPSIATVSGTGLVTGVAVGTSIISYTALGCTVTRVVTVDVAPVVGAITGVTSACIGMTTALSSTSTGGVWSSTNPAVGTVSTSGVVAGLTAGTTIISYTITNACGSATATTTVNVAATLFVAPITGVDSVCPGFTDTLHCATGGGTWSSTNITLATVSTAGVVTGVAPGYDTIVYTVTNSCGTVAVKFRIKVRNPSGCPIGVPVLQDAPIAGLHAFPNPNTGSFILKLSAGENETAHVVITNVLGMKVKELMVTANRDEEISLEQPPGIYIISASTPHQRYAVKVLLQ